MNRRKFLTSIVTLWTGGLLSQKVFAQKDLSEEVKDEVDDILNQESIQKLEKSITSIWQRETDFFAKYFQIDATQEKYPQLFVNKVKDLQKAFKFDLKSQDGVLWSVTLRKIYLEYYMKTPEKLEQEQKYRMKIYEEMQWYQKKTPRMRGVFDSCESLWFQIAKKTQRVHQLFKHVGSKTRKFLVFEFTYA